jgi:hypothetical protein
LRVLAIVVLTANVGGIASDADRVTGAVVEARAMADALTGVSAVHACPEAMQDIVGVVPGRVRMIVPPTQRASTETIPRLCRLDRFDPADRVQARALGVRGLALLPAPADARR